MTHPPVWIPLSTIVRKEVARIFRIWTQTFLPSVITMVLYFIIFGAFIGSQVESIQGYTYMQYIVPGLVMMPVITNAFSNVVSSFFGAKFMHSIEEILVSPTPNWVIIAGYSIGGIVRGLVVGLLVFGVSLFFTRLSVYRFDLVIVFIVLTSVLFSLGGFLNGLFAKKFDDVGIVPTFILTPLTYLGGVFYSITMLPPFWQNLSKMNPIFYMINGFRYGFLGVGDVSVTVSFVVTIGFVIVAMIATLALLKRGIGLQQ
jgi:ABC-2 type transport system permease protein